MRKTSLIIALLVFQSPARILGGEMGARAPSYRVIVNLKCPVQTVSRKLLADIFLKKVTRWPDDGRPVRPIDLAPDSESRRQFSEEILARSPQAVKSYWQQLIFSGQNVPPPELADDSAVIALVRRDPESIGYVAGREPAESFASRGVREVGLR